MYRWVIWVSLLIGLELVRVANMTQTVGLLGLDIVLLYGSFVQKTLHSCLVPSTSTLRLTKLIVACFENAS